ncbi:MAG: hypothetical protein KDM64_20085, partial [Verrucomicrobiae bacterium]|nr:hypothetical protein [Verrucomicrobiae bacterium]
EPQEEKLASVSEAQEGEANEPATEAAQTVSEEAPPVLSPSAESLEAGEVGTEEPSTGASVGPAKQEPQVPVPDFIDFNEFQRSSLADLHRLAQEIGLRVAGVRSKHHLIFEILCFYSRKGTHIEAEGVLETNGEREREGHGFLRWPQLSFASNADDVYVAQGIIRKYELKPGNLVRALIRAPRDRE